MASTLSFTHRLIVGVLLFAAVFQHVLALSAEYCSDLNTAQTPANSSIYQSNGLCQQFCVDNYAFAILQDNTCWCSNNAPGESTSTDDCNTQCPGYPDDLCGNTSEGLYGYFALDIKPTGTVGAAGSSAAASTTSAKSTTEPDTTSTTPEAAATSTSHTTKHSAAASSSSSWTPTPVTSLETITGQVRTVTVTPSTQPSSLNLTGASTKKDGDGGLSTGGAVGLTVGLVALVALVCSIIYFCIRKRRKEKARAAADDNNSHRGSSAGLGGHIPSRTMSENSRYVLGTDGRQVVETWEPDYTRPGSRRSRLMPVDPRLDPFAPVYQRGENKSRESVNTIRDDHDYSRRVHQQGPILRATNPDE